MTSLLPRDEADSPAKGRTAGRLRIFHAADAKDLGESDIMSPPEFTAEVSAVADYEAFSRGADIRVLFRQDGPDGFSLIWAWFGADYPLPRHTHNTDCLYYVISGEAIMGKQVLRAGSVLHVPANTPYRYRPGPDGVQVLEVRKSAGFDIQILDQEVEHWRKFSATAREMAGVWDAQRPAPFA